MRSPFPGMDPWLELRWRDVHASLIIYIRDQIQRQLPEPLVARAEEDVAVNVEDERPAHLRPDVQVAEDWRSDNDGGVAAAVAAPPAVAEPLLIHAEPEVDRWVEVLDPSSGSRIVTVIEALSPSNKLPGKGHVDYVAKQRAFVSAGVNVVEIDLVRQGGWTFAVDPSMLPASRRAPYMVCVFRATRPSWRALYPLPLRERLPRIAIPLRPQDRDVVLDLQQVLDEAYENGRYDRTDYSRPLTPPLPPEDAAWITDTLRQAGHLRA